MRATPPRPAARHRLAAAATVTVGSVSRRLRLGGGSVIGGRVGMLLDPDLLAALASGRQLALVSGTNGKTTTTRLLAAALRGRGAVATSAAGANMPAGAGGGARPRSPPGAPAVLEVDEGYVPQVAAAAHPAVIALLNLSRDQLDRVNEVRMVARRWRDALDADGAPTVVANADDPLVAWAAAGARRCGGWRPVSCGGTTPSVVRCAKAGSCSPTATGDGDATRAGSAGPTPTSGSTTGWPRPCGRLGRVVADRPGAARPLQPGQRHHRGGRGARARCRAGRGVDGDARRVARSRAGSPG